MEKRNFDADWEVSEAQGMFMMMQPQWQPVRLPHDASIAKPRSAQYATGSGGGYAWGGTLTYRKKLHVPEQWRGQSIQLEFEGVYMSAEVSVNRSLLALHPYGYTSFLVDLAPHLNYGAENTITVTVNNSAQPNSRWYSGTGIYRHVWLRLGTPMHILPWGVFVSTPLVEPAGTSVVVATEVGGLPVAKTGGLSHAYTTLRSSVLDARGAVLATAETSLAPGLSPVQKIHQTMVVSGAHLWSLDDPYRYTLLSEVLLNGVVVDTEKTVFGVRTIAVDAQQGFRLNGLPLKLKGGCVHHDNGLLGAASYDRAEERKIELMKSAGFNAIRCAHNPPAPAMLDACDRLGMLVIDESFDCWRMGKNPNDYHVYFEDWWERDTESMVKRDRNHPSIIMWSIGNEVAERTGISDGYAWAHKQAALVRKLDPTRLVTSALPDLFEEMSAPPAAPDPNMDPAEMMNLLFDMMGTVPEDPEKDRWGKLTAEFAVALDVVGYNYLANRYDHDGQTFPGRVVCGTETFPHRAFDYWKATERNPQVIGDFVWTSLDYLGESGIGQVAIDSPGAFAAQYPYHFANCGDFDICGFKRPQSYYRDILWGVRQEPYLAVLPPQYYGKKIVHNPWGWEPVIDSWTFPGWEGKPTRVEVYCAADEVELWVNGVSAGRQPAGAGHKNKAVFQVEYQPGTLSAVGYSAGKAVGRTALTSAGAPAALRITPDCAALRAEYGALAYLAVEILDAAGERVAWADHEISFAVTGLGSTTALGEVIALGAANPLSEELYTGTRASGDPARKAFEGRLMAVIRASGEPGEIQVTASAAGLRVGEVTLQVK